MLDATFNYNNQMSENGNIIDAKRQNHNIMMMNE